MVTIKITSPHDQLFLRDVAAALQGKANNLQVIFRRCPADFSNRYDTTLEQYQDFIISIDPIWNVASQTGWSGYFPLFDDIAMQLIMLSL